MEKKERLRDTRKVFLFLPLLVMPFLVFAFYAMGGGTENEKTTQTLKQGINTELPDASFKQKKEPLNKLDVYERVAQDSGKTKNSIKDVVDKLGFSLAEEDPKTVEINEKLRAIQREMEKPEETPAGRHETFVNEIKPNPSLQRQGMDSEVDRLEALMKTMQQDSTDDEEVKELNGLLQTILDIQHPERIKQTLQVEKKDNETPDSVFKAIPAVIVNRQKVVQGATVKLRLQDSLTINGHHIPKDFNVFATCRIANQRVLLNIRNIRLGTAILPVNMSVYGLDGMEGLDAPEAVLTEAANLGTGNLVSGIGMYGLDQSIASQVAGAGMDAARNIISKKVRKMKVKLKAGEPVLLKNNNLKNR